MAHCARIEASHVPMFREVAVPVTEATANAIGMIQSSSRQNPTHCPTWTGTIQSGQICSDSSFAMTVISFAASSIGTRFDGSGQAHALDQRPRTIAHVCRLGRQYLILAAPRVVASPDQDSTQTKKCFGTSQYQSNQALVKAKINDRKNFAQPKGLAGNLNIA